MKRQTPAGLVALLALPVIILSACARLPYTTQVVHQDPRVTVTLEREVRPARYDHPAELTAAQAAAILRGFSARERQRLPLRWFAEELPPQPVFRQDEIAVLAPHLAEALGRAGPDERVHFALTAPGLNPVERQDVTAGWLAVRGSRLLFELEYFHTQMPITKSDPYDYNYPSAPPPPRRYLLYFEPGRFWTLDQRGRRSLDYRGFLSSQGLSGRGRGESAPDRGATEQE